MKITLAGEAVNVIIEALIDYRPSDFDKQETAEAVVRSIVEAQENGSGGVFVEEA